MNLTKLISLITVIGYICVSIYLFIVAYLIGFKNRLDLLYSINQVKIAQYDLKKRRKLSIFIACIYMIAGIGIYMITGIGALIFNYIKYIINL